VFEPDPQHEDEKPAGEAPPPVRTGPPWERPAPLLHRLLATTQGLLFHPGHFFSTLRRDGNLIQPLLYAILTGIVGGLAANLYVHFFGEPLPTPFKDETQLTLSQRVFATFFVVPVIIPLLVLLTAGAFHFFLHLMGGARHPFLATARLSAYTHGATSLFLLVPGMGPFLQLASYIVLSILGMADIQETTRGRAAAVVLLPFAVLFMSCCVVTLVVSTLAPGVLE
jgi:hypothetical protein